MEISQEQYDLFEQVAEEHDLRPTASYSGRGMYGRECVGVTGDSLSQVIRFLFDVKDQDEDLALELVDAGMSTDSMGLSTIWYWSSIRVEQEEVEEAS